jgi:hypothetical protein
MTRSRVRACALAAGLLIAALPCGCRSDGLSAADAGREIQSSPAFAFRAGSPVGRRLVEVVAVRRISASAIEVEFTWRDAPAPAGSEAAAPRTSMALFRRLRDGTWALASLYKVH